MDEEELLREFLSSQGQNHVNFKRDDYSNKGIIYKSFYEEHLKEDINFLSAVQNRIIPLSDKNFIVELYLVGIVDDETDKELVLVSLYIYSTLADFEDDLLDNKIIFEIKDLNGLVVAQLKNREFIMLSRDIYSVSIVLI